MKSVLVVKQMTPGRLVVARQPQPISLRGAGVPGRGGANGLPVELQTTGTHLQWRLQGASDWIDLLSLSAIEGQPGVDGVPVELQASATHLQWRLVGGAEWSDLIALSAFKGADGVGVPPGGATGQVLRKKSAANHDTEWAAAAEGGGGGGGDALGSVRRFTSPPDPSIWVRGGAVLSKAEFPELYALVGDRYTRYTALAPEATTERGTSAALTHRWVDYSPTLNLFAAVDSNGKATYSTDGLNWLDGTVSGFAPTVVYKVVWLNDKFFALGNSSLIATSDDGINWTGQTIGTSIIWNDIAWTGTNYVLVGISGNLRTSPTGLSGTWTSRTSTFSTTEIKSVIAQADGKSVISGASSKAAYSTDHGVTWTTVTSGGSGTLDNLVLKPGTGEIMLLSTSTSGIRISSDGGATWSAYAAVLPATGFVIVTYNGKVYGTRANGTTVVLDPVALTWSDTTDLPEGVINRTVEVPSKSTVVVITASTAFFSISGGAFKSTRQVVPTSNTVFSRAGGKLFAVSASISGIAVSGDEGVTWARYMAATWSSGNSKPVVVESGGVYLYHGVTSQLWRSTDGYDWRRVASITMGSTTGPCVAVAGGAFYALASGVLYKSIDGLSWAVESLTITGGDAPASLVGVGDVLVLVATTGVMYRREGAGSWEVAHSISGITSLCVTGDGFIAGTNSSYGVPLLIDPDTLQAVCFDGDLGSSALTLMPMSDALGSGANDNSVGGRVSFDNGASWFMLPMPPFVAAGAVTLAPGKGSRFIDVADGVVVATNYCLARYKTTIPGTHFAAPWAPPGHYVRAVA